MHTSKDKVHEVIFGTETKLGKRFDVFLLWIIIISVFAVVIESVPSISSKNPKLFTVVEWILTIIFTLEYFLRIWSSHKPKKYILSFWGIVDLLAIIPTYLSLFLVGAQYFVIIRSLRLLRVFRILKLARYSRESAVLVNALKQSRHKISVFLLFVILIVFVMGTMMYVIEGETNGFRSIPESIYWSIVTVTTVGYGDITPKTFLGQFLSSIMMILGYAIIAIPTGIVGVALNSESKKNRSSCTACNQLIEKEDLYCRHCGEELNIL